MKAKIFEEMYGIPEIKEILIHPAFLSLGIYKHHGKISRLHHVLAVAEMTFSKAKTRNLDVISATRAALLHDLYFYHRKPEKKGHIKMHPVIALQNAIMYFTLNEIEKDAIINHMWPLTRTRPRFKESRLVSSADKASAIIDFRKTAGISMRTVKNRLRRKKAS